MITLIVSVFDGTRATFAVLLAVISAIAMIVTKGVSGVSEVFHVLALVFSGVSILGLKKAVVAEVANLLQSIQGTGTSGQGTSTSGQGTTTNAPTTGAN